MQKMLDDDMSESEPVDKKVPKKRVWWQDVNKICPITMPGDKK